MSDDSSPIETAADLLVFAPLGLALTVGEELPKLAAKGRARLEGRLRAARMVGQFAVTQGRREVDRRFSPARPAPAPPVADPPVSDPPVDGPPVADPPPVADRLGGPVGLVADPEPSPPPVVAAAAPSVASLAIPGYDSLSASQVVQRLAGLSGEELTAVGAYETATRGRRTILARVSQLQSR